MAVEHHGDFPLEFLLLPPAVKETEQRGPLVFFPGQPGQPVNGIVTVNDQLHGR